ALTRQELAHVPRDLGLVGERQPPLAERETRGLPRSRAGVDAREEAVDDRRLDVGSLERRRERATDDRAPASGDGDTYFGDRWVGEDPLLRRATLAHEPVKALRVELSSPRHE